MKRIVLLTIALMVTISTFCIITPIAEARSCVNFPNGNINKENNFLDNWEFFSLIEDAENTYAIDTAGLPHFGCKLNVEYRDDWKIYVDEVLLTKEDGWKSGTRLMMYFKLKPSVIQTDKQFKKIANNVWTFDKYKMYLEPVAGFELKCLKTGQILREGDNGYMFCSKFQATKLLP